MIDNSPLALWPEVRFFRQVLFFFASPERSLLFDYATPVGTVAVRYLGINPDTGNHGKRIAIGQRTLHAS